MGESRVRFDKKQEVFVGKETSDLFLKWHVGLQPLRCHGGIQAYIHDIALEDVAEQNHDESDEASWMSTWTDGRDRDVQNIQNHGQQPVTDDPGIVHLEDTDFHDMETMSEADDSSRFSV